MKVLKFGGSSVAKPERVRSVIAILNRYYAQKEQFTVVFSAFGGATDGLLEMARLASKSDISYRDLFVAFRDRHMTAARELLSAARLAEVEPMIVQQCEDLDNLLHGIYLTMEVTNRTSDYVVSFGERLSSFIIAHALDEAGVPAAFLDARKVIKTNKNFGNAKVDFDATNAMVAMHYATNTDQIQIVTGFIGSTSGGLTTTLGRGGSDYTAAILAAGLNASVIEIWTDVDGVLTADPRKVKKAFTIPTMTYAEAMEMSHFGAKVIYPPTLQPALAKRIPLYIKNTFNPDFVGTFISDGKSDHTRAVQGVTSISKVSLLTLQGSGMFGVPGTSGRLFAALANGGINIILITQGSSEYAISFAVQPSDARRAKKLVEQAFEFEMQSNSIDTVKIENDLSIVAIIGENMRYQPGIAGRMFTALGQNGINCVAIAQGSSELNVSVVIPSSDEAKALNALHDAFFLSDTKVLHLFMVGMGLIGSTLLAQMQRQAAWLRETRSTEIKLVGLANTRKMLLQPDGISLDNWRETLDTDGKTANLADFVAEMKALNLSNSIFIDNTAGVEAPAFYEGILDESIAISTPNKIATSSTYAQYQSLKATAARRGVAFEYETNVGAGLPIISTLNDLITSGDRILKIEGVLSGSMSFVFNTFRQGLRFSEVVAQAKQLGFTEPDPRVDLSGQDVRRKLIILARETGLPIEAADVVINHFLPQTCTDAPTIDAFFEALAAADNHFEQLRANAAADGKVLRMIAKIDNGAASIGVQAVGAEHPFYQLSGSDNMIVFTTERYRERPLVVRGPGAGSEVTAAGVFAEIVKIGNRFYGTK